MDVGVALLTGIMIYCLTWIIVEGLISKTK